MNYILTVKKVQFVGASKVPGKLAIVTEYIEQGNVAVGAQIIHFH